MTSAVHPGTEMTPERRSELLAVADPASLAELAERVLADGPQPRIILGPEIGMAMLQVREPVEGERFYLSEVLVTRAEVELKGHRGWAMRMGDDRVSTLAASILDAVAEAGGEQARAVVDLCAETSRHEARIRREEWSELAPTVVHFEDLDR